MQEVSNPQAFWEWVFFVTHTHEMLAKLKTDYYRHGAAKELTYEAPALIRQKAQRQRPAAHGKGG